MKQDYNTEAKRLAIAVDIAIESFTMHPPKDFTKENLDHIINVYSEWKYSILHPAPQFRKIASLKYDIQAVFTYFQEGGGDTVEYFWSQLAKENLGYIRENKLQKIVNRGKIKGHIEYELIIDSLVPAEQDGRITQQEAELLRKMIGEFETKRKNIQ